MGLVDKSASLGTASILFGFIKDGLKGSASKIWKSPTEAKSLAFGGALGFATGSDSYIDHAINAASMASLVYTPLIPFVSAAFIAKGAWDCFKGVGSLLKGDVAGATTNFIAGGLSVVFALPGLKGVSLLAKAKGLGIAPLTDKAKKALEITSFAEPGIMAKVTQNVNRLTGVQKGLTRDLGLINGEIAASKRELVKLYKKKGFSAVGTKEALTASNNPRKLTSTLFRETGKSIKAEIKAISTLKEATADAIKVTQDQLKGQLDDVAKTALTETLTKQRQELASLTRKLTAAQKDYKGLQVAGRKFGKAKAAKHYTETELRKVDDLLVKAKDVQQNVGVYETLRVPSVHRNNPKLLAKYNETLQTINYNPKKVFKEIMHASYGKDGKPFVATVNKGIEVAKTAKAKGAAAAAKETATATRDTIWRAYDWFKAGKTTTAKVTLPAKKSVAEINSLADLVA